MPTSLRCLSADRLPPGGSSHVTHSGDFPLIAVSQSVSQTCAGIAADGRCDLFSFFCCELLLSARAAASHRLLFPGSAPSWRLVLKSYHINLYHIKLLLLYIRLTFTSTTKDAVYLLLITQNCRCFPQRVC